MSQIGEGQFSDVKAAAIPAARLTFTISALANSDGGDVYIGIGEAQLAGGVKRRIWSGFRDVEAANGHVQSFERLFPLGTDFQYEFLRCEGLPGLVLHFQVSRTQSIMKAVDGTPYVRRGAQNLPVTTARNGAIVRLFNKFPDPPNRDVGEGLNTAFEKMHQLGLKEPTITERHTLAPAARHTAYHRNALPMVKRKHADWSR